VEQYVDLQNGIETMKVGETKNDKARTVYPDSQLSKISDTIADFVIKKEAKSDVTH
jgi:hypothetical protein